MKKKHGYNLEGTEPNVMTKTYESILRSATWLVVVGSFSQLITTNQKRENLQQLSLFTNIRSKDFQFLSNYIKQWSTFLNVSF
ncbi:hypothetical protein C0J52_27507 [Blattella germanica]|nr:hypothetical protein C0J52_27507 [Blattella germanica]